VLLALFVVAFVGVVAAQATEPDVATTFGAKWGHWTLERLGWKHQEIKSDLSQTRAENKRVHAWGTKTCKLVKEIWHRKVVVAKEAVSEWKDILAIRRGQRGYHVGRQSGYNKRHAYITGGTKSRRAATDKKAWCKAHKESCDRWRHERHLYLKNHFHQLKKAHGKVTVHARKRVAIAKVHLRKSTVRLANARKGRKAANAACKKTFGAAKAHWKKRIDFLKTRLAAVNQAIGVVKDARTKRLATYKPFYMTKCRYIGGKHHMYYCSLDTNNSAKAHHRFRVCKHRGAQQKTVGKLKFRCYK